jgi:putative transcriptional regulator
MEVKKKPVITIEADPSDAEDRPVNAEGLDKALQGRRIRRLRHRLGLSQSEFAESYGIPLANIRQYEIGRTMPPPAVRAYLAVIEQEPETTAQAYRKSQAA